METQALVPLTLFVDFEPEPSVIVNSAIRAAQMWISTPPDARPAIITFNSLALAAFIGHNTLRALWLGIVLVENLKQPLNAIPRITTAIDGLLAPESDSVPPAVRREEVPLYSFRLVPARE
ncbi:MAG: hypothetical protein Q7S86_02140 [bacterium]|nr:hypothetical protein [bacterium]